MDPRCADPACNKPFRGQTYWQRFCSDTCRQRIKMRRYRKTRAEKK